MTERRPSGPGWVRVPIEGSPIGEDLARGVRVVGAREYRIFAASAWQRGAIATITAVEEVEDDRDDTTLLPHDHVSVSLWGRFPPTLDALAIVRRDYGLVGPDVEITAQRASGDVCVHLWRPRR